MAQMVVRNLEASVKAKLRRRATRRGHSMEQEVRDILESHVAERASVLEQIEDSWAQQGRRPEAAEIEAWISTGRE